MRTPGKESQKVGAFTFLQHWVSGCLGDIRHERRVAALAMTLLDATRSLHQLNRVDRRLLKMAALVHDVGRCINAKEHPRLGARMLVDNQALPLAKKTRRALAFVTRYHRGAVPMMGHESILHARDDRARLRLILAFLRAADALDGRSLARPELSFQLRGRSLRIKCRLPEPCDKSRRAYSRRKKFRLLEEMLGIEIDLMVIEPRRTVAA